jgi:hypothetical protein
MNEDPRLTRNLSLKGIFILIGIAFLFLGGTYLTVISYHLLPFLLIAPIVLAAIILIAIYPIIGIYLYLTLIFTIRFFTDSTGLLPWAFNFLPDILLLYLFLIVTVRNISRQSWRRTPIDIPLILFILLAFISGVVNSGINNIFINSILRSYLKPILIFYLIVYLQPSTSKLFKILNLLLAFVILQVPVSIVQATKLGVGQLGYSVGWDFAGGTVGYKGANLLVILGLMAMAVLFGLALFKRRWILALAGLALFIPMVIGEGKAGFFYGPAMILYLFFGNSKFKIKLRTIVLIILLFMVVYIGAVLVMRVLLPESPLYKFLTNPITILTDYERPLASGSRTLRLGDWQLTWPLMVKDPLHFIFGYGPGSASLSSDAAQTTGKLVSQYAAYLPYFGSTQLTSILLEYGVSGFLIYCYMLLKMLRIGRSSDGPFILPPSEQAVIWAYRGLVFIYVTGIIYIRLWNLDASGTFFWAVTAIMYLLIYRSRRNSAKTTES